VGSPSEKNSKKEQVRPIAERKNPQEEKEREKSMNGEPEGLSRRSRFEEILFRSDRVDRFGKFRGSRRRKGKRSRAFMISSRTVGISRCYGLRGVEGEERREKK